MADNLIPEPQIQATNIPTGGGAQVRFDFVAPDNTFANLSKTIASAGQTMVNFNQLEENERKARDEFRANLDQIHGLTQTGQLSDAEYMAIVDEANAKAQKEGIIKAHENWSTMNANSKDRAMIIAKAYEANLNERWQDITNPDNNFATKISTTEALFFSPEDEEGNYRVLGTDFNGNPVTADTSTMSPMELVALSQAISAKRAAAELAREEVKSQRMIEARTMSASTNAYDAFEAYQSAKDNPQLADQADNMLFQRLRQIGKQAHNQGVQGINDILKQSLTDYVNDTITNSDLKNPIELKASIDRTINFMQNEFSLRDQDNKPVPFAGRGTQTNADLDKLRKNSFVAIDALLEDVATAKDDIIADFDAWGIQTIGALGASTSQKEREELNAQAVNKIIELAESRNVKLSLEDAKNMVNEFDKIIDMVAIAPDEDKFTAKALQLRGEAKLFNFKNNAQLGNFAIKLSKAVNENKISASNATTFYGEALTNFQTRQADKLEFLDDTSEKIYNSLVTSMLEKKNANTAIRNKLKAYQLPSGGITFASITGMITTKADERFVDALYKDNTQMLDIANNGGRVAGQPVGIMFETTDLKKIKNIVPNYDDIEEFFQDGRTFKAMKDMSVEESAEFKQYLETREDYIAQISAAIQHAKLGTPDEAGIDPEDAKVITSTNSITNWINYVLE